MFSNRISNNNGSDDWDRELISVPRLEKMASVSVAIALWNHAVVTIPNLLMMYDYGLYPQLNRELRTLKWMCALPVPKSLTEPIERHFCSLSKEVDNWISYIHQEVFLTRGARSELYQLIDDIIWHPNGTIHPTETARNLLKSEKLTIAEKFRFACTYCLREEVERIRPMMEDENDLVVPLRFSEYPLHCYWTYYCADQLNEINNLGRLSIDEFMIRHQYVNNWSAIEYFFYHLDGEKRVRQAIWLFDEYGLTYLAFILLKLNESQRLSVMMDRIVQIIDKCTSYKSVADYDNDVIISTWNAARDVITEQQFVDLFGRLLENQTEDFVLTEIWSTTREDLKRHILNHSDYYFIKKLLGWWESQREKENCPTVVSSILMDQVSARIKREISKEKFFSKWCEKVIRRDNVKMLDNCIKLCLPEEAESAKFKLSLTQSKFFSKRCQKLIIDCETEELARLLEFAFSKTDPSSAQLVRELLNKYSGNLDQRCLTHYSTGNLKRLTCLLAAPASPFPEIISDYKSKLLRSPAGFEVCSNLFYSTNDALIGILADSLSTEQATEFKKEIIFTPEGIDKLQNMIVDGSLSDAERWARWFLESDTDRVTLRNRLIQNLKKRKCKVNSKTRKLFSKFLL